jgi:uncharacterized membrane protein YoaK (UPF0700 family)
VATDDTAIGPRRDEPSDADAALPGRAVARLLATLSAAAGCLDVVCLTRLGGLFASVITGNLVQLGHAIASVDARLAVGATAAVGSYALGVAAGAVALRSGGAGWRRRATRVLAVEAVLLAGVAAGWWATGARPGHTGAPVLLGLASSATGMQSAVTISVGVRGASTTYLTGTLTDVVRTVVGDPHRFGASAGGASRLAALLCGAAIGALALRVAPLWAPVLTAALVAAVVVIAGTLDRRRIKPAGARTGGT